MKNDRSNNLVMFSCKSNITFLCDAEELYNKQFTVYRIVFMCPQEEESVQCFKITVDYEVAIHKAYVFFSNINSWTLVSSGKFLVSNKTKSWMCYRIIVKVNLKLQIFLDLEDVGKSLITELAGTNINCLFVYQTKKMRIR